MANQTPDGRSVNQPDENRPSWGPQDERGDEGRERPKHEDKEDRDPSESDRPAADRESRNPGGDDRERQGQSGYGAGRSSEDRSMMGQQATNPRGATGWEDRQGMATDDRFTGRSYNSGYNQGGMGYGGHGDGASGPGSGEDPGGGQYRLAGPHRGKGPQGYKRSDDRIKDQICEALSDDDHIDATHIEVIVKNGDAILTGFVDDESAGRATENLVRRVSGVVTVQNELRIGRGNQNAGSGVGMDETETTSDRKQRA